MMKKGKEFTLLRPIVAFALLVVLLFAISCSDDDKEKEDTLENTSYLISEFGTVNSKCNLEYNEENQLINVSSLFYPSKLIEYDESGIPIRYTVNVAKLNIINPYPQVIQRNKFVYDIKMDKDTVHVYLQEPGVYVLDNQLIIDKEGKVIQDNKYNFKYDVRGNLISRVCRVRNLNLRDTIGDIIFVNSGLSEIREWKYEYDDKKTPLKNVDLPQWMLYLLDIDIAIGENNIKKAIVSKTSISNEGVLDTASTKVEEIYTYDFTYNALGYPKRVEIDEKGWFNEKYEYDYTYIKKK